MGSLTGGGTNPTTTVAATGALHITDAAGPGLSGMSSLTVLGTLQSAKQVSATNTVVGNAMVGSPVAAGSLTAGAPSSGVNVAVKNGSADYGTNNLELSGTLAIGNAAIAPMYTTGLMGGKTNIANDFVSVNPGNLGVQLGPVAAFTTAAPPWADNTTFIYTGQYYSEDGGVDNWCGDIDDSSYVKVGTTVVFSGSSNTFYKGSTPNLGAAGWQDIEIRVGNGTGGHGMVRTPPALGIGVDFTGTKTVKADFTVADVAHVSYRYMTYPGDAATVGRLTAGLVTADIVNMMTTGSTAAVDGLVAATAGLNKTVTVGDGTTLTVGASGISGFNALTVEGEVNATGAPITMSSTGAINVGVGGGAAILTAGDVTADVFNLAATGSANVKNLLGASTATSTATLGGAFTMRSSAITGWKDVNVNTTVDTHGGAVGAGGAVTVGTGSLAGSLTAGAVTANALTVTKGSASIGNFIGTNPATSAVSVAAGQTLNVGTTIRNINTLTVDGTATLHSLSTEGNANETSIIRSLVMNPDLGGKPKGTLDVKTGNMIIDYTGGTSPLTQVQDLIRSGANLDSYGTLLWTGTGITSSVAADPEINLGNLLVEVGVRTAKDPGDDYGFKMDDMTTMEGGVSVPADSVVVKYTYAGDADLNGVIDASDYAVIDWYATFGVTGAETVGWMTGDFNLDGVLDASDYALIDWAATFQSDTLGEASGMSKMAVPEPATLALMLAGGAALVRRRKPWRPCRAV
jgi:hypothetical protein